MKGGDPVSGRAIKTGCTRLGLPALKSFACVLGLLIFCPLARAQRQNFELDCPGGTQPIVGPSQVTLNSATGKMRQNECVDTNGNLLHIGAEMFTNLNNRIFADQQAGADACAKILASFSTLASAPGNIDASGFTGNQSCAANPFPNTAKPGKLWLGNTTYQTTASWVMQQGQLMEGTGIGTSGFGPTLIQAVSGFPASTAVVQLNGANGIRMTSLGVDCNNQTGAIGVQVNDTEEMSALRDVIVTGCPNVGIAIGDGVAGHAQNMGPLEDLYVRSGNATVSSNTIPVNVNVNSSAFRGIHGMTIDFSSAAPSHPTDCMVINTSGTYENIHVEGCVNGVHIKANNVILSNLMCGSPTFAMTSCILADAGLSNVAITAVNGTNLTNMLVDNTNSITLPASSDHNLAFYAWGGGPGPIPLLSTSFLVNNVIKANLGSGTVYNAGVLDKNGNQLNNWHIVQDTATLSAGTVTVTLTGASAFTSATSYTCIVEDETSIAATKCLQNSGSSITITGTGTDVVRFILIGN